MINYNVDSDGIATITWDMPGRSMNVMNDGSLGDFVSCLDKAFADDAIKGVIVTSGKKDFVAGADLEMIQRMCFGPKDARALTDNAAHFQKILRRMETGGKPFVAAINGTALGGGLEICLACHYRVAADNPRAQLGLPEVKIGLLPLRRVSEALARIRDGKARRLDGHFPTEIAPLATELNSLIQHSEEVVGRARTHVSNLAHFLKTPLSVLAAEADAQPGPLADSVQRQVFSMRRQVDHYLSRARAAGSLDVLGNRTQVSAVMDDLARVIGRIHAARGIVIDAECSEEIFFRGERQDLEEILGNLIDNGCKWARSRVRVRCEMAGGRLVLTVEDDGPGLSAEQRAQVGERGERLDESVPGSGLGLAIVRDISKLYGGFFLLDASPLGGVMARLELPAIV